MYCNSRYHLLYSVLAGEFTIVNKYLLRELTANGYWTEQIRNKIIADGGSVQNITEIPNEIRHVYKTVWEIPQRSILDMSADRGAFICQSQSMNVHISEPSTSKLTSMHFYAWKKGLKTGMYYLRTRPKAEAIQFTVNQEMLAQTNDGSWNPNPHPHKKVPSIPLPTAVDNKPYKMEKVCLEMKDCTDECLNCGA